jgi:hypothetical protein
MIRTAAALIVLLFTAEVRSETVDVKYRGPVDLKTFECRDINRSSFIQRVCYDRAQSYMLISLKGSYYHYCELPSAMLEGLMGAPSMASSSIKTSRAPVLMAPLIAERIGSRSTKRRYWGLK